MQAADEAAEDPSTLYHYTDDKGLDGIVASKTIRPSLKANNPNDARHGDGQYLSDIEPGTMELPSLSRQLVGMPFMGYKFTHYVEIDVTGLGAKEFRKHVFLIEGTAPLDVNGRITGQGKST